MWGKRSNGTLLVIASMIGASMIGASMIGASMIGGAAEAVLPNAN